VTVSKKKESLRPLKRRTSQTSEEVVQKPTSTRSSISFGFMIQNSWLLNRMSMVFRKSMSLRFLQIHSL